MNSESKIWENLKADYLSQIEKVLASVDNPRTKEILEDVGAHLDRRFGELSPNQQTKENLQRIIFEMGPASDYAELLGENTIKPHGIWRHFVVNAGFSIAVIATIIILCQIFDRLLFPYGYKFVPPGQYAVEGTVPVTTHMTLQGRYIDMINFPFIHDPNIIGKWESVDFVNNPEDFVPGKKNWQCNLWLKELRFSEGGETNWDFQWTKGLVIESTDRTASHYVIKTINGSQYMFFEWKGGDYTILHRKPGWYVLVKTDSKNISIRLRDTELPEGSFIDKRGFIVDKIDYPFVNDPNVIGKWESVDFVREIEEFVAGKKQWQHHGGKLYLYSMNFGIEGNVDNVFNVDKGTTTTVDKWTKGLVLNERNKTASRYTIKKIDGSTYMFYEWKSGDYGMRHARPHYYVLEKTEPITNIK
jgi:hypothetical protein